jgi:hypothetical protein
VTYEDVYYDEDGNPAYSGHRAREEPDCLTCSDRRTVLVDANGQIIQLWQDDGSPLVRVNCPDCNPTEEQHAAQLVEAQRAQAEWGAAVARGDIDENAEAPF